MATYLLQAVMLAVASGVGVAGLLHNYFVTAASMAHLSRFRAAIVDARSGFLVAGIVVWLASQVILAVIAFKNRRLPDIKVDTGEWLMVFSPLFYFMWLGLGVVIVTALGFLAAGVARLAFDEGPALWIGALISASATTALVLWFRHVGRCTRPLDSYTDTAK
jgi:uncharacterized membrane protein